MASYIDLDLNWDEVDVPSLAFNGAGQNAERCLLRLRGIVSVPDYAFQMVQAREVILPESLKVTATKAFLR